MPKSHMARLVPFNINISAGYLRLRMTHVLWPQSLRPSWREYRPARACPALRGLAPIGAADPSWALLQTWGTAARRHPVGGLGSIGEMLIEHNRSEEHTSELQSLMRISYA